MIDREASIPSKNENYRYAESIFYDQFNDTHFYVEDADQEELYFIILRKLFPTIQLNKIFPLGGKPNVIKHCRANSGNKRHIYLVDKDFDDMLGSTEPHENLFYLKYFCIENYFLEEEAFVRYVIADKPKLKTAGVKDDLTFERKVRELFLELRFLFNLFYIVQQHEIENFPNTKLMPESFCLKDDQSSLDIFKVCDYKRRLVDVASRQGKVLDINEEFRRNASTYFPVSHVDHLHSTISGKHVIHMLFHHLKRKFRTASTTIDSFCYRLAEHCKFDSLTDLRDYVSSYINA